MLNHDVLDFRTVARQSLILDLKKRNVPLHTQGKCFLGYQLTEDGFLDCKSFYGCQSDWPDLVRYIRKLRLLLDLVDDRVIITNEDGKVVPEVKMQQSLYMDCVKRDVIRANSLSIQGSFLRLNNVHIKSSHCIFYNWNVNDHLMKFVVKARLSILPTNFTTFLWNRENNPRCPFNCNHTESVAHLLNGCHMFRNFYSARHNRIVDIIMGFFKQLRRRFRIVTDKHADTVFPNFKDRLLENVHRKPDVILLDDINKSCFVVEITVCFDMYLDTAFEAKMDRYRLLIDCLESNGYSSELIVLCFGSLGCVKKDVWSKLKRFTTDKDLVKKTLKSCSISTIIGSNYIWRNRVKKVLGQ